METTNIITREELASLIERRAPVLIGEVLAESYWTSGHIPTARSMPLDEVTSIVADAARSKDDDIVLYCASETCQNSHIAARKLAELGYTRVRVFAGGKAEWQRAGLLLEKSAA